MHAGLSVLSLNSTTRHPLPLRAAGRLTESVADTVRFTFVVTPLPSTATLSELAVQYAQNPPTRPWFTPHSRWARRIVRAADHEAWLLAWLPGQGTDLHDHGGLHRPASAAFAVARGALTEFTVEPGYFPKLTSHEVTTGASSVVDDRTVHGLLNTGNEPAVSVHVYAPRLDVMRAYLFDETGLALSAVKRAGDDW